MQVSCSGKKNVLQVWCFHVQMLVEENFFRFKICSFGCQKLSKVTRNYVEKCAPKYYFFFSNTSCDWACAHDYMRYFACVHGCQGTQGFASTVTVTMQVEVSKDSPSTVCAVNIPTAFLLRLCCPGCCFVTSK